MKTETAVRQKIKQLEGMQISLEGLHQVTDNVYMQAKLQDSIDVLESDIQTLKWVLI